jgi:opine dehydrogenase
MRIAIVGAGAVGLSSAALLVSRGHEVRVWSGFPKENDALAKAGGVKSEGSLDGFFTVPVAPSAAACLEGADAVMLAAPAFAHASLMAAIAPHIRADQYVIVHTATGMSSLMLARQLAQRGVRAPIIDLGTSVCTSRKSGPTGVKVAPLKAGVDMATLPADRGERARDFMTGLFGDLFNPRENILAVSLNNHNAVYHVPAFVFSLALVEQGKDWNIWGHTTPLIARYVQRLDDERLAVARMYGVTGIPAGDYVRRSVGVEGADLASLFAAAAAKRPNPTGPKSLDDRYITEDVPFGLVFFAALGRAAGVPMPLTEQLTAFVSAVYGRDFAAEGHSLAMLGIEGLAPAQVLKVVTQGF